MGLHSCIYRFMYYAQFTDSLHTAAFESWRQIANILRKAQKYAIYMIILDIFKVIGLGLGLGLGSGLGLVLG